MQISITDLTKKGKNSFPSSAQNKWRYRRALPMRQPDFGRATMKRPFFYFLLFVFGGSLYYTIELCCRGFSHWSMFCAGGLCFCFIDMVRLRLMNKAPLWVTCALSALIITAVEFVIGCMVNLWAGLAVWDYSHYSFNLLGQVCLRYTAAWFFLSLPAIWLCDLAHRATPYLAMWFPQAKWTKFL